MNKIDKYWENKYSGKNFSDHYSNKNKLSKFYFYAKKINKKNKYE